MPFTDQQNTELNTAYQRVQAGTPGAPTAENAGDVANLAYATKQGWKPTTTPVTVPNSTGATDLGTTPPVTPTPPPVDNTTSFVSGLTSAKDQYNATLASAPATTEVDKLKAENPSLFQRLIDSMKASSGQGTALVNAEASLGIPEQQKKLADVNTQIAQVSGEFNKAIEGLSAGTGLTTTIAGKQGQLQRQKAVELGALTSMAQAIQGNIATAQATAKRTVDLQFQDAQNNIDIAKAQLENNYQNLSSAEKKQADQMNGILALQQRELDKQKESRSQIYSLMIEVAKNGASQSLLNNIKNAKSIEDAISIAGPSLKTDKEKDFGVIGQTTDENGITKNVYGFIDKKTGKVSSIGGEQLNGSQNYAPSTSGAGKVTTSTGDTYDIASYATDPNHETSVQSILNRIGQMKSTDQMDAYIKSVAPNSPITGQMIADASKKFGVSWEAMMAIMQQDSSFGTAGKAIRTFNPGNVGNTDSGATVNYGNWQSGVDAVAKNLAWRKVSSTDQKPVDATVKNYSDMISSGKLKIGDVKGKNAFDTGRLQRDIINYMASNGTISKADANLTAGLTDKINLINGLIKDVDGPGSGVIGPTWLARWSTGRTFTGSEQEFVGGVKQLISQGTLDALLNLKKSGGTLGALDQGEKKMLQESASKIDAWEVKDKNGNGTGVWSVSESAFKNELERIKNITKRAIDNSLGGNGVINSLEQKLSQNPDKISEYNILVRDNPNLTDDEISQALGI